MLNFFFFFQAEDGIRDLTVTGVQTCALPIFAGGGPESAGARGVGPYRGGAGEQGYRGAAPSWRAHGEVPRRLNPRQAGGEQTDGCDPFGGATRPGGAVAKVARGRGP